MQALIDNTTLHAVKRTLDSYEDDRKILQADALTLLHFAEHIMFAEKMEVSTFEIPKIREVTEETVDKLNSIGCLTPDGNKSLLLEQREFTDEEYAAACMKAAGKIQEDLTTLTKETLNEAILLADKSTRPIRADVAILDKWVNKKWSRSERELVLKNSLSKKAVGAFDYTMACSDGLFEQFKIFIKKYRKTKYLDRILKVTGIYFRIAINQELAKFRHAIYSPAPQRANVIMVSDKLFRHAVSKEIEGSITNQAESKFTSKLIQKIQDEEVLPLPIFAIYYLRQKKIKGPNQLLECARKLRDEKDVLKLRSWFSKWEDLYASAHYDEKEKAKNELKYIAHFLNLDKDSNSILNIFRIGAEVDEKGAKFTLSPDTSVLSNKLIPLINKYSRRQIFLSIAKELKYDENIGADLNRMLNSAII